MTEPLYADVRRAHRDTTNGVVSGVAAGLAEHLGLPVAWVRVFFVVTVLLSGFGVMLYGALWLFLPAAVASAADAPGLEGASRANKRPRSVSQWREPSVWALVAIIVTVAWIVALLTGSVAAVWPLALGALGVGVLWMQADASQRERWLDANGRIDLFRVVFGDGGPAAYARVGIGVCLIVSAVFLIAVRDGSLGLAWDLTVAVLLGVVGLAVVLGPWAVRLVSDLSAERAERIRSQERADVAAHLHDSVLQTLALIQRNAENPAEVARLARGQERDMRRWLFTSPTDPGDSVAAALRECAAEIEDAFAVPIEVVVVGDGPAVPALVAAAREAMTNAARHSGAAVISVYAEAGSQVVEVFIRDRGAGFDVVTVAEDRRGISDSIRGRMERHGGCAEVRSTLGEGTEVKLTMPVAG
ncbi:ATP-binding protein [soil metagenome]